MKLQYKVLGRWKSRSQPLPLPDQTIQISFHGDVYERGCKQQARRHLHGQNAEMYIREKFGFTQKTLDLIDWSSIKDSNQQLSVKERATQSKYVYRWSFTSKRENRLDPNKTPMCPLCGKEEENQHHVQCCKDRRATKVREELRDELEHDLEELKTHPDLATLIIRSLQTQENQQVVVDVTGHEEEDELRGLVEDQRQIGWDKLKLGF